MTRSAIRWYGGKASIYHKIVPLMPPCNIYVECFGGGAGILLNRKPVKLEVYNDLNDGLYTFLTVLSDPDKFELFYRRVQPLLLSHKLYLECRGAWKTEPDQIIKAVQFFVDARQSFSGKIGSGWSYDIKAINKSAAAWMNTIDSLPEIHRRLRGVQVHKEDWGKIIDMYDGPDCLFYLDPPYIQETRVSPNVYDYEMTADDHRRFIDRILNIQGMAVISGYIHPIYEPLEKAGWRRYDFDVSCNPSKTINAVRDKRVESVWVKPYTSTKTRDRNFI